MFYKEDKFYYYILINIILILSLNPFISPILLKSNDLQLPVFILALSVLILDFLRKDLLLHRIHFLILFFSIILLIYLLPDSYLYFVVQKRITLFLGFLIFYCFYKYSYLINVKFFVIGSFINIFGVFAHYFQPDLFIFIAEIFVRTIKITEFYGRGASGFTSEPLYAATLLFITCILSKYYLINNKLSIKLYLIIQFFSVWAMILTQSGTGYIYILFLSLFVYFSFSRFSIILKFIALGIVFLIITSFDQYFMVDNRGYYVLRDLFFRADRFICDQSLLTRIHSILYGLSSILNNPLGMGSGASYLINNEVVEPTFQYSNNIYFNEINTSLGIVERYLNFCGIIDFDTEYAQNKATELIQSNIFMSNIGMYSFEYGIIFIIFLFLLFTIDLKINYLNIMLLFSCLFVLQSSVSFAFPLIWFIISLTKKSSGIKHA